MTPEDTAAAYAAATGSRAVTYREERRNPDGSLTVTASAMVRLNAELDIAAALNGGRTYGNHPSHDFGGFDGRCMNCDCRPWGRHAPLPCPIY